MDELTLSGATLTLVVSIFVCYRLGYLVARQQGPLDVFGRLRRAIGRRAGRAGNRSPWHNLADLVHCPLCLGVWISLFLVLLLFPLNPTAVLWWIAISGGQVYLERTS